MDAFEKFLDGIRARLKKKGYGKKRIKRFINKVIKRNKDFLFLDSVDPDPDPDFDDSYEFCGLVNTIRPMTAGEADYCLPFIVLPRTNDEIKELRIQEYSVYYSDLQASRGEDWFPPEESDEDPINMAGDYGRTPLIQEAINGDLKRVKVFIKGGADLFATDNNYDNAYQAAVKNEQWDVAEYLLKVMKKKFPDC